MVTIKCIKARRVFDSRGNPTLEADCYLSDGYVARAAVPSGVSTGIYKALELRDGGSDFHGKGVLKAVENVNIIIGPALVGKDPTQQTEIDNFMVQELDGTSNEWGWCKEKLGATAILAVSIVVCKAGASVKKIPLYQHIANLAGNKNLVLPVPAINVSNGGSHAGNKLAMQEFMILPVGACSFKEAFMMGTEVFHHLTAVIKEKDGQGATNVGDAGRLVPNIQENKEGLELLKTAIANAGYTGKVVIGMDVAASGFYDDKDKTYDLNFIEENNDCSQKISGDQSKGLPDWMKGPFNSLVSSFLLNRLPGLLGLPDWLKDPYESLVHSFLENNDCSEKISGDLLKGLPDLLDFPSGLRGPYESLVSSFLQSNDCSKKISGDQLKDLYKSFVSEYPIVSIEDPFGQDDWIHHGKLTEEIGQQVQIVGDDLLVTNPTRVAKAIKEKTCNALLLKVNQIGSVTESIEAVKMSKHAGWGVMASYRSLRGETEDIFIADLSVGLATGQIKTGAPFPSEHLAYNQLLRIEEELGAAAVYAGQKFRAPVEPY